MVYQIWDGDRLVEEACRNKKNFDYDYSTVAIGTGSMYPMIKKGHRLYYEFIDEGDQVRTGEIYAYKKNETVFIVHRLVGIIDANKLIFKGDNNDNAEVVNRKQVVRRSIGIRWD